MSTKTKWWRLDLTGVVIGAAFVVLSLTPSLLPRPALLQGAIAGISFALGYLIGAAATAMVGAWKRSRRAAEAEADMSAPSRPGLRAWVITLGVILVASLPLGVLVLSWQNGVRAAVEMPPLSALDPLTFALAAIVVATVFIILGKSCSNMYAWFRRRFSGVTAVAAVAVVVTIAVVGGGALGMAGVDRIYLERNGSPSEEVAEPSSEFRSAGPDSQLDWEELGRHGANFVGGGPSAAEIEALTGVTAEEPIRVYAGLASADDTEARARLVLAELERTGAFDREWLVVATTTGSGWLEPQSVDAFEYLHAGDTAIASMQYAYTPSWVSFVFDPDAPVEAATVLFDLVHERWSQLPEDSRPQLIVYGLSLGAHGTQAAFGDVNELRAKTDGAMLVGSPNSSEMWRALQAARDAGSPVWRPVLDDGREVRWISKRGDETLLTGPWDESRVLYLQHATDPITWLAPTLLWSPPEWLEPTQRADDVSNSMRWIPVITGVQLVVDMLMGESVPARHGHNFGDVVLTGWRAITGDSGLDDAAFERVQAKIESYAESYDPVEE